MLIGHTAKCLADFLLLCVRIPKSGSSSLDAALRAALSDRQVFYLPNTLDLDGCVSGLQRLRFQRGQVRNLLTYYRSPKLARAFRHIESHARPGDLVCGGHIDFPMVRDRLTKPVKIVTMIRNPYDRCRSEYWYARQNYFRKSWIGRLDCSTIPQVAALCDFRGYVDFLFDHRHIYGDVAARYLGVGPSADIASFFAQNVFHAGPLEHPDWFERILGEKLGRRLHFPHLNARGGASHVGLTMGARRKIERIYSRDFEIYEHVMGALHRAGKTAFTNQSLASTAG